MNRKISLAVVIVEKSYNSEAIVLRSELQCRFTEGVGAAN